MVNTEKEFWNPGWESLSSSMEVHHIAKKDFDHGGTRRFAAGLSRADILVFMTQDALPADEHLIGRLIKPLIENSTTGAAYARQRFAAGLSRADILVFMTQDALPADEHLIGRLIKPLIENSTTGAAYARQLPAKDCNFIEKYTRSFNYPEESSVKCRKDIEKYGIKTYFCSNVCAAYDRRIYEKLGGFVPRSFNYPEESSVKCRKDIEKYGIKTYFCSNVCAAYDRRIYEKLGGFVRRAIFNEDMIYAGNLVKAGYGIAYTADAEVYHSHNYTAIEQFHRNFDLGVSQAEHPEIFDEVPSEGEGLRLVKKTFVYLVNFDLGVSQAEHPEIFDEVPSEGEGLRLVKKTFVYLVKQGRFWLVPKLIVQSGAKYAGYFMGKRYKKLPEKLIRICTMNPSYWEKK